MSDAQEYVAGSSSLVLGADSYTLSTDLDEREYVSGMNVVCRGGIVQTRPGTRSLFCLPKGNFQGATLFTPDNGTAQIVAAVDGKIYASAAPFTSYRRLWNIQFSPTSKYLAWCVTLKSTDYDNEGNLITLDNPYSILIMQDGVTRAAYWDGGTSGHLNPANPPDVTDVVPGYSETPIGLWMIWSGNRLWVSRGNQIFASDIGNPLKFTETLYLNEGRAFYLTGPCTGMIEVPSDSAGAKGFIAFTDTNGTLFQSYIQDRTLWLSQPLFQNTLLPNIGCVAPRSLVTQYGLNWWFGPRGFTNINAALRQNITSRVDYQDNQMFTSKAYLGPDLSSICASFYENYLMVSTPSGDVLNRHTWVLDQAPMDGNINAWTGFWTGWRPIEWCRGLVNGSERSFFGSIDYDGNNRIWEAMLPDRTDNGCAITCYLQTREHAAGDLNLKSFYWSKIFLSQIYGEVDLDVYLASTKGGFQKQKSYHIVANKGQIFSDQQYSETGPLMVGNRVQSRTIRTPGNPNDSECNQCGVESNTQVLNDFAFSHLLVWSGQMGVRAYQMHMRSIPERQDGDCEESEVGPRTLNASGCGGLELLVDGQPFEAYTNYAEGMTVTSYGTDIYIRRTATSPISEDHAKALAECAVEQIIAQLKDADIAPGVYDSNAAEIGDGTYVVVNSAKLNITNLFIYNGPEDTFPVFSSGDTDTKEVNRVEIIEWLFLNPQTNSETIIFSPVILSDPDGIIQIINEPMGLFPSGLAPSDEGIGFRFKINNSASSGFHSGYFEFNFSGALNSPFRIYFTYEVGAFSITFSEFIWAYPLAGWTITPAGDNTAITLTVSQEADNPDGPGECRQLLDAFSGAGIGQFFNIYESGSYDPSLYGPFGSIRYQQAHRINLALTTNPGAAIALIPVIRQSGFYYVPPLSNLTFSGGAWSESDITRSNVGWVRISDFDLSVIPGSPDFSISGNPIFFGFIHANSAATLSQTCGRVANWIVTASST